MAEQQHRAHSFQSNLSTDQIKILADPNRLAVLRLLMAVPGSLTSLGKSLGEHPAWVRHHLLALEQAGFVRLEYTQTSGGRTEKFYRAAETVFLIQEMILPAFPNLDTALLMGSHDLALEAGLLSWLETHASNTQLISLPVGSLDGLTFLRQGLCHVAGCHLLDVEDGEYNLPYVRRFFPDREMTIITVAERQQGLMVAPGNPLSLHSLEDLAPRNLRFANRQRGSGTRLWLDRKLAELGMPTVFNPGFSIEYHTHTAAAEAIKNKLADCGIGLLAAARKFNLDFIPLFFERYDLVLPSANTSLPALQPLFDQVNSASFRKLCTGMGGYETNHSGSKYEITLI